MWEYRYEVESGQFSYQFDAPLLGKVGDLIKLYDYSTDPESEEIVECREFTINHIDKESKIIECIGDLFD